MSLLTDTPLFSLTADDPSIVDCALGVVVNRPITRSDEGDTEVIDNE